MEDQSDRGKIQDAIGQLMVNKRGKVVRGRMANLKQMAEKGIKEGGSSHTAFLNLVDLILSV